MKHVLLVLITFSLVVNKGLAQKKTIPAKYPSLFWEITGNGLKKPSYLFGTMHVSSKLVFHLSDSFYHAIKNVEVVALELNPDIWQGQMVRLENMQENYARFTMASGRDYLTENSFRLKKYEDELKLAMRTEPTVVNSLLYRSYKAREDFEEDTFLDLYIFQTGKKLGKRTTGVEDYFETEKIVMEAYTDMAKEKKKRTIDTDGESYYTIENKIQDAYRRGDLDVMDSLDKMMERSDAFREKFLYKRNEIQANSIDTIIKKNSLFVGVGAAHLPGNRGIIELLRKKGYRLRPIKMADMDAVQKEAIDKLKVPVAFATQTSDDGFYSVSMPGPLFKLTGDYAKLDRRQYSDMSNGSYYLVTRVKTHAAFLGLSEEMILKKTDSILYDNIPGKIISKKKILKNGYHGFDIVNKTRRGDLQRFNIFVTPFEIILFKMGGKESYIEGKEGELFFSSLQLKPLQNGSVLFQPAKGGFVVQFPHQPSEYLNGSDFTNRWEYEAVDKSTGDAYLVFKKSIHHYGFLDSDTFDLSLMEESFRDEEFFEKQQNRKFGKLGAYTCLDVKEKMKNGAHVFIRHIIKGPHYYLVAAKSKNKTDFTTFFNSFKLTDYSYPVSRDYIDTFFHFRVKTPVKPLLDEEMRAMIVKTAKEVESSGTYESYADFWPRAQTGTFRDDSTGESLTITIQEYPKYYYPKDSVKYWQNEIEEYYKNNMILHSKDSFKLSNEAQAFRFTLRDTGSSRTIDRMIVLKDNHTFNIVHIGDTASRPGEFVQSFYNTFNPVDKKLGPGIFENKLKIFFEDMFSSDSTTNAKATKAISNLYYGEKGADMIVNALQRLSIKDKNYFNTKAKLIQELGYIQDTMQPKVVRYLKNIYEQTADTALFQNEIFTALARHKTQASFTLLKELILQDPPIFDEVYSYTSLFNTIEDSLKLAKTLFPELLQLTTLDDYKQPVLSLLVKLVDSNLLKATEYESYFPKIYFDAKVEMKKQQGKDEKRMEEELKKNRGDDQPDYRYNAYNNGNKTLSDFCVLLVPEYDKNISVQKFFTRLLNSKDPQVRLNSAISLLKNNKPVADSIILQLAADDLYRSKLFSQLEAINQLSKFPAKYKTQLALTLSLLVESKSYNKIDSLSFLQKKQTMYMGKTGIVYFYKYRLKKEDDWKIALCGLQPLNEKEVSANDEIINFTDKKLKTDTPVAEQLQKQLFRMIIASHKSGKNFFNSNGREYYEDYTPAVNYEN